MPRPDFKELAYGAIDAHAHLAEDSWPEGVAGALAAARAHGVGGIVAVAADDTAQSFRDTLTLVSRYPDYLRLTAGIHPHYASRHEELWPELRRALDHPQLVGLGEFGLDFHYDWSPRPVQMDLMKRQLELALRIGLPIVLHLREALDEAVSILDSFADQWCGVIHCFNWGPQEAADFLQRGFHLSIPGIVTFGRRAQDLREAVQTVPLDRLLVETDCPYLAPAPYRGRTNQPAYVALVLHEVARLKGLDPVDMAKWTRRNSETVFGTAWASA